MNILNTKYYQIYNYVISESKLSLNLLEIIKYCNHVREKYSSVKKSNVTGWQSPDFNINHNHKFFDYGVIPLISQAVENYRNVIGLKKRLDVSNYWINYNYKNSYNREHVHPYSIVSAVYYVQTPRDSGNFRIINPEEHILNFYLTRLTLKHGERNDDMLFDMKNEVTRSLLSQSYPLVPRQNNLFIFPSWMKHSVETNYSDDTRISIAFNFD